MARPLAAATVLAATIVGAAGSSHQSYVDLGVGTCELANGGKPSSRLVQLMVPEFMGQGASECKLRCSQKPACLAFDYREAHGAQHRRCRHIRDGPLRLRVKSRPDYRGHCLIKIAARVRGRAAEAQGGRRGSLADDPFLLQGLSPEPTEAHAQPTEEMSAFLGQLAAERRGEKRVRAESSHLRSESLKPAEISPSLAIWEASPTVPPEAAASESVRPVPLRDFRDFGKMVIKATEAMPSLPSSPVNRAVSTMDTVEDGELAEASSPVAFASPSPAVASTAAVEELSRRIDMHEGERGGHKAGATAASEDVPQDEVAGGESLSQASFATAVAVSDHSAQSVSAQDRGLRMIAEADKVYLPERADTEDSAPVEELDHFVAAFDASPAEVGEAQKWRPVEAPQEDAVEDGERADAARTLTLEMPAVTQEDLAQRSQEMPHGSYVNLQRRNTAFTAESAGTIVSPGGLSLLVVMLQLREGAAR